MNTLRYTNGISRYTLNGEILDDTSKPYLSFEYHELYFTPNRKSYVLYNKEYILNKNKIDEITSYIKNIEENYTGILQKKKDMNTINILQKYLDSTDWMIIREIDTGKKTPPHIKEERMKARNKIHSLRD